MTLLCLRYLPPLVESQVNPNEVCFKPDERRKSLFKGKKFIFLSSSQVHYYSFNLLFIWDYHVFLYSMHSFIIGAINRPYYLEIIS
jgi:hypothetical protein